MILFTFKQEPETRGEHFPCSAFRWSFQIGFWHIGFVHQYQDRGSKKWSDSGSSRYDIWLTSYFRFRSDHVYYDGPHCSFTFGWIQFCWGNENCKKCMGEI